MSIGLVCTQHLINLRPERTLGIGDMMPGFFLACDFTDEELDPKHYHEYSIDLSRWYCPEDPNTDDTCNKWWAAVNLDLGSALDESFDRSMHTNWFKEEEE